MKTWLRRFNSIIPINGFNRILTRTSALAILLMLLPTLASANINQQLMAVAESPTAEIDKPVQRALLRVYRKRQFEPIWIGENELSEAGIEALQVVQNAERLGLLKEYGKTLNPFVGRYDYKALAELDYQLSVALLELLTDLSEGHLEPIVDDKKWADEVSRVGTMRRLSRKLHSSYIQQVISNESPPIADYEALLKQLHIYNRIVEKGGWPLLPASGATLKPGMVDPQLPILRARLKAENYLFASGEIADLYDRDLQFAVERFQLNHGLTPDGIIGPQSRAALNITAAARRQQLLVNLERMRWLPDELGERYLWVNIPSYRLTVFKNQKPELDMAVIVGRTERPTPVFYDEIEYLEINPYWNVPDSIAWRDYLPKILRDVSVLERDHIKVRKSWHKDAEELDPNEINWAEMFAEELAELDAADLAADLAALNPNDDEQVIDVEGDDSDKKKKRSFPFHLRQEPGEKNSLGRVKFMFPNEHYVYLHDTPKQKLFNRSRRAFSSGCVRVSQPEKLAQFLIDRQIGPAINDGVSLSADDELPAMTESISYVELLNTGENQQLRLEQDLPVYLVYFTTWVDQQGRLQFREDIYNRDSIVAEKLAAIKESAFSASRISWAPAQKPAQPQAGNTASGVAASNASELSAQKASLVPTSAPPATAPKIEEMSANKASESVTKDSRELATRPNSDEERPVVTKQTNIQERTL